MTVESAQERRIWELLTRDFYWEIPADHPVTVYEAGEIKQAVRLQIFEIAVTTVLAEMQRGFSWSVTPNRPDDGVDFVGVQRFLDDTERGIAATITVGGQCKKRTKVNDVVGEVAGSLVRMADAINPTFFVVALSARLTQRRVDRARGILERQYQRHCHIFDRAQIEGLMGDHLGVVAEILREGLTEDEVEEVLAYFRTRGARIPSPTVNVLVPRRVLAGTPFRVDVEVRWALASARAARLWWRPAPDGASGVSLLGPIGADAPSGLDLTSQGPADDPLRATLTVELTSYSAGKVDLGEIVVGLDGNPHSHARVLLGEVDVVETMRPRFFDRPVRIGLSRLSDAYDRMLTGVVSTVGVVGAGGSGKSRMCEEFALAKRRRGCSVVVAKQTKTHEAPHRVLAELLASLSRDVPSSGDPATDVVRSVAQYDEALARRADPTIRALFEANQATAGAFDEESVVSAVVLSIVAANRSAPLIVHLQDLHWCNVDTLLILERIVLRLTHPPEGVTQVALPRVLFVFEGRIQESGSEDDPWSSAPFEAFLRRLESPSVECAPYTEEDGRDFCSRLFEDRYNVDRLVADEFLDLQRELIDDLHKAAGTNPFHVLEQVRLFKELGVVAQNPTTGLLYMVGPKPASSLLPDSVFAAIQLRWQYLRDRRPALALLLWASALLEDQLPAPLFGHLWRQLAPNVSSREIDATDILWTGDGQAREVVFRHENYFETIRRFMVSETDHKTVVDAYCEWFGGLRRPSPADRFRWARAMMTLSDPDLERAKALLVSALKGARKLGDEQLARLILAYHLDLVWQLDEQSPLPGAAFLRHCDEEMGLCRELLGTDRDEAAHRLSRLRSRLDPRVSTTPTSPPSHAGTELERRDLAVAILHAQVLFNNRHPAQAADLAEGIVDRLRSHRKRSPGDAVWEGLEMEALYTLSCAQALSGDFGMAVCSSAAATEIARGSSFPLARRVVSTYGTMLVAEDPKAAENKLRECAETWPEDGTSEAFLVNVHLSKALVHQAYRCPEGSESRAVLLGEALELTTQVFDSCRRLGFYPNAAAAALLRGVVSALVREGNEASWFAQGVAAAARGRQLETLWRSHINLATALHRQDGVVTSRIRDHARAAVDLMVDTLSAFSEPDRSPRFGLLRIGMAIAASMLISAGDDTGTSLLERYPLLRSHFSDPAAGVLAPGEGEDRHYQWLRVDGVDYVLY